MRKGEECRAPGFGIDLAGKHCLARVERDHMRAVTTGSGQVLEQRVGFHYHLDPDGQTHSDQDRHGFFKRM